jgi:hypothetical protein
MNNGSYKMLNHLWLTSGKNHTENYNVTGFFENRWALQCLVELTKHLNFIQWADHTISFRYAHDNILYSKLYQTDFNQQLYTKFKVGTDLLAYETNATPGEEVPFTYDSIVAQLDEQSGMADKWESSKTNLPKSLTHGSASLPSQYHYDEGINELNYSFGREINANSYVINFTSATFSGISGNFGFTADGSTTTVDIMGEGITDGPDSIYLDLRQSKFADPPGNLEDRYAI